MAGEQIDKLTLWVLVKAEEEVSAQLKKVDDAAKATAASIEASFGKASAAQKELAASTKGTEANMKRLGQNAKELDKQLGRNLGEHMRLPVLTKALQDSDKAFDEFQDGAKLVPSFLDRAGAAAAKANSGFTLLAAGTKLPGVEQNMKRLGQNFKELNKQGGIETEAAAAKAKRGYSIVTAAQQQAAASAFGLSKAHRDAATTMTRELGGAAASVGLQINRLTGLTNSASSSFARQGVRGATAFADGLGDVFGQTKRLREEQNRFDKQFRSIVTSNISGKKALLEVAEAEHQQEVSSLKAAAGAAQMGLAVGAATAALAAIVITGVGAVAVFKELASRGIDVSRALETTAIRASREAFDGLKASMFDLSNSTGIAIDQLGPALGRALLKTGGDADKASKLLKVATDTALASGTDTAGAVERLGDVIRSYGLDVSNVKAVSNSLLVVQRLSGEEYERLAEGISGLAPQAKELGIDFNNLAASLTGITKGGVPAQQAIFGLRSIFAELGNDASQLRRDLPKAFDISPNAFISKGLIGVVYEMERALQKNNSSLKRFLGESRRYPTLVALEAGAKVASAALLEMESGVDQAADGIAKLQDLPGRGLTNFFNELSNVLSELGDLLVTFVVPTLRDFRDLFHEIVQLAKEHPEEALEAFKGGLSDIIGGLTGIPGASAGVRFAIDRIGAVGDVAKLAAKQVHDLRVSLGGVDAAVSGLPDLPLERQRAAPPKPAFVVPESSISAVKALQAQFGRDEIDKFIKSIDNIKAKAPSASAVLETLTQKLRENGEGTAVATRYADEFSFASEKQAKALSDTKTNADFMVAALSDAGVSVTALITIIDKWFDAQRAANAETAFAETVTLAARNAVKLLTNDMRLNAADTERFAVTLKSFYDDLAKQNEQLKRSDTNIGGETAAGILLQLEKQKTAYDDARSALDQYASGHRTTLESVTLQLTRIRAHAEEAASKGFLPLAAAITKAGDAFEKAFVEPARRGFAGGFGQGIRDFIKDAQDNFKLGQDAALEFANSFGSAIENLLLSIGTGKNALKSFAVAVLQSIAQMIAKLLAFKIAASFLGFLFPGGGGGGGGGGGTGLFGFPSSDTGGTKTFDRGGIENFDVGGSAALRRGGINTRPTMFMAPKRAGMTEAFVPLPGPNRGIPVEFRNSSSRGGEGGRSPMHFTINIATTSLDPRSAGQVIMQQIPVIVRGIAAAIDGRHDSNLTAAIRGVGR